MFFFKKTARYQLSPEFYRELDDSLTENLAAKFKRDGMGSVVQNRGKAIDMLESVQRSARSLISAFRMCPVQSRGLSSRISQTTDLLSDCEFLVFSLKGAGTEERIENKVQNMLTILAVLTEQGLREIQKATGNKYDAIVDRALKGRSHLQTDVGRKLEIAKTVKATQVAVAAQSVKFAGMVTEQFDGLNQAVLTIEGLSFFLHVLSRVSFRQHSEMLRETIYDPTVREIAKLFGRMFSAISPGADPAEFERIAYEFIDDRGWLYSQAPYLVSPDSIHDRKAAFTMAAEMIAEAVGYPGNFLLIQLIRLQLLHRTEEMDLAEKVKSIEALL